MESSTTSLDLSTPRLLGGIGMILILLSPFFVITGIVGYILVLISMDKFSKLFKEAAIFRNYILNLIFFVVAILIGFFFGLGSVIVGSVSLIADTEPNFLAFFLSLGLGPILGALLSYVIGIISSYFYWKAHSTLGRKTNQTLLSIGGILFFIGYILIIFFGLGAFLMFLGLILITIGFFKIPEKMEVA